jgi:hypothetical protein
MKWSGHELDNPSLTIGFFPLHVAKGGKEDGVQGEDVEDFLDQQGEMENFLIKFLLFRMIKHSIGPIPIIVLVTRRCVV